jgi:hypothetical protein
MSSVAPGDNVVLGSGRSHARLQPRQLVIREGRTTVSVPYQHIRDVFVLDETTVVIELHDTSTHHTPLDRRESVAAFARALRGRVGRAGAPDAGTPAVEIVTSPLPALDISARQWRRVGAVALWYAAVLSLGIAADTDRPVAFFFMGLFGILAFLALRSAARTGWDRFLLGRRGITVQARLKGSIRLAKNHYVVRGQRFVTLTGEEVAARHDLSSPRLLNVSAGDFIDIRYDPRAPAERVLYAKNNAYFKFFGLLLAGALLAIGPLAFFAGSIRTVIN